MNVLRRYELENGLTVYVYDETSRYFCNYFNVSLKLTASIEIVKNIFDCDEIFIEIKELLGDKVKYVRTINKNAVLEDELERVKELIINDFEQNCLPYLSKSSFIKKFILKKFREKKREQEIERLRKELSERENSSTF